MRRLVDILFEEAVPGDAPPEKQVHLFDFDDTLGVTTNANAVMVYRDGKPVHKSKAEVEAWMKSMGVGTNALLDPGIVAIPEKDGAFSAYVSSAGLAKIQSQIPKERQFATGFKMPTGASGEDEVLVDYTPSSSTDVAATKPIASTIDKLKKANASGAKTAVVTARTAGGEVEDIHGKKLTATNAKDMEDFLTKQGAKPNAGVFGVSGGNKGEKIKNQFVDQAAQKPEEVHFYDDLSKNTVDVEQNMAGKIPAELHIYGPGEFAHDEADPNRPDKSFDPSGEAEAGKKPAENSGRRYSLDPILERWSRLAGIKS
jgi:hypothetical protein